MQSIISKGKDLNEAILLGLELMEATKKEVNIEIIQHHSKSFFRSKQAIVRLTKLEGKALEVKNQHTATDSLQIVEQFAAAISDDKMEQLAESIENTNVKEKEIESLSGKAWVKNGQLHFQSSPTRFPLVTGNKAIKILKNNELVKEITTILAENDVLEMIVENEEKETKWNVSMDEHKLHVLLHVEPGYRIIRTIIDIEPDYHVKLKIEEKKETYNTLAYEKIIEELESLKVKHGFNQDEIMNAMKTLEPGTFEIATGIKPKAGKDGWIELRVDIEGKDGLRENENGHIDFREIQVIPTVKNGEVIAIVHPPIPGDCGYTVMNDVLPAKQTHPLVLKAGRGVSIVNNIVVATESGRPKMEQRGQMVKVSIMPKLTLPGNVDLTSGNVRFMGDVEILGGVEERMIVETEGNILVHKTVNMASLTASGAVITYGTIIGSRISAGKNNMLVAELGHLLGTLHQQVEKMIVVIKQLKQSPAFKDKDFSKGGLQPLIRILIEQKFKSFPPQAKKYVDIVRKGEDFLQDNVWREISVSITQLFLSLTNEVTSLERIIQLSKKMKELHEMSKIPVEPDSFITIPNVLNSQLYCSGNILITGKGSVNTKLHAGGSLKILGTIRGGEVYGRLGVEINEVGAEIGIATVISVPSDQEIIINKALEGTTIKIGNVKHTFDGTRYHIRAHLKEDRIVFD